MVKYAATRSSDTPVVDNVPITGLYKLLIHISKSVSLLSPSCHFICLQKLHLKTFGPKNLNNYKNYTSTGKYKIIT